MYTVILYVGYENDINRYRLWIQDFENAGMGVIICVPDLDTEEVVDIVIQTIEGIRGWNLIIIQSRIYEFKLKQFLRKLKIAVYNDDFLLSMPERVWLILKKIRHPEDTLYQNRVDMTRLPSYCRLVECFTHKHDEEKWKENLKRLCIITLFAVNQMPSENFVVYQRHLVDIDIDVAEFWDYIENYKRNLRNGIMRAEWMINRMSVRVVESNIETVQTVSSVKWKEGDLAFQGDGYRKEAKRDDRTFQRIKSGLMQEIEEARRDIEEKEKLLHLQEKELAERDLQEIKEKKKQDEVEIIKIKTDLFGEEKELEENEILADRSEAIERLLHWSSKEIILKSIMETLIVLGISLMVLVSGKILQGFHGELTIGIFGVIMKWSVLFGLFTIFISAGLNGYEKVLKNHYLKKVSKQAGEFMKNVRKGFTDFVQLYYKIMKKQMLIQGHRLAEKNKTEKIEMAKRHGKFCSDRLKKIKDWENVFCGKTENEPNEADMYEWAEVDMLKEPELEAIYRMIDMKNASNISINKCGKTVRSPFSFVKGMTIERDFEYV